MNKSSVYLKVYPQCFNLPVRKGVWYVAAHPSASPQSSTGLIVFLSTKNKKESCENLKKNCYILPLKASLPTTHCITLPALLVHLHMRINSLPYLHEAGQVLMSRLVFKLSSKLSIFISFTSTTPKRLKLQLRRSQFVFPFLGPVICFLRTGPAKPGHQHTGQVAPLCHHVPQAMWTQHLSPISCALHPIPRLRTHFNLHPSPCLGSLHLL